MDWRRRARQLKAEVHALYLACRDPRVPLHARLLAVLVVGYALSPVDLIPDFIPVLGYLDDLVLLPLGIALTIELIPAEVLADCRERARADSATSTPSGRIAAVMVIALWLLLLGAGVTLAVRLL